VLREPITDKALYARLVTAITGGFFGGHDPGHHDYTRYVRLPAGINNKAKRVAANGGVAPNVICTHWDVLNDFDWQDIAAALDKVPGQSGRSAWAEAEGATFKRGGSKDGMAKEVAEAAACVDKGDYIFAALDKLGDLTGSMQGDQGYVETLCPRSHEHSSEHLVAGWNPVLFLRGQKGLSCFHTHGHDSNAEIEEILRERLDAKEGPGAFDKLKAEGMQRFIEQSALSASAVSTPVSATSLAPVASDQPAALPAAAATFKPKYPGWERAGADAPITARKADRVMLPFLARGAVSQLISRPNLGKSQAMITLACAIAAEQHEMFGEATPIEHPGQVVLINNEDPLLELYRRRDACLRAHDLTAKDLKHDLIFRSIPNFRAVLNVQLPDRSRSITVTQDMRVLADLIREDKAAGKDTALVILDTQASTFRGISENSNDEMAEAGAALGAWAQELEVAVLLVHHNTKDTWSSGTADMANSRGPARWLHRCARCRTRAPDRGAGGEAAGGRAPEALSVGRDQVHWPGDVAVALVSEGQYPRAGSGRRRQSRSRQDLTCLQVQQERPEDRRRYERRRAALPRAARHHLNG